MVPGLDQFKWLLKCENNGGNGMAELLAQLVDGWTILIAILAVGVTEALMRATSEKVTRWKYAMAITGVVAIAISIVISLKQKEVGMQDGAVRGIISAIIGIIGYDGWKSMAANLPFIGGNSGSNS